MSTTISIPPGICESPPTFFRHHFRWYRTLRPFPFVVAISLEGLLLSLAAALLLGWFDHTPSRTDLPANPWDTFFLLCFEGPLKETFLYQLLPFLILRCLRARWKIGVLISTGLFAGAHAPLGFAACIAAGVIGGFYFAFTYAHFAATRNHLLAFAATAVSHSLHNGSLFILLLCAGSFEAPTYARLSTDGLDVMVMTDTNGKFRAAIVADQIGEVFDTSGTKLYGPFRVITSSGIRQVSLGEESISFDRTTFRLREGAFFYVYFDRKHGPRVVQVRVTMDESRFAADPSGTITECIHALSAATRPSAQQNKPSSPNH